MTPTPQVHASMDAHTQKHERVVISGMSGLYPQSNHVKDLEDILYSKKNPVAAQDSRWKYKHPDVRNYTGKVPNLDRFDAQFFKVHFRLGFNMDAMGKKILEQSYQAIYDAGVNPVHLSGKKVGVFIGCCFSETEKACFYVAETRIGFGIAGCSRTMFANRVSYWLNAKGPSMAIDESCCSSIAALEQAYLAISRGECEAAIVGGANLCLHPQTSIHYGRVITLCKDGKTKSFDKNADGIAMSEAINVLFLQKAKYAKRIYAEIINVKSEFSEIVEGDIDPKFSFYRNPTHFSDFLEQFYRETRMSPNAVEYVEAFGSAIPQADKAELQAIERVFCKDRNDPLLVGSVMSNIGHGEAASGISAITKVLLGYQRGEIAGNLHYTTPRDDVDAVRKGKIRIIDEHTRFRRTYTAVNGLSVTGINAHVLLHGQYKPKDLKRYKSSIPHLVTISGRQDTAVQKVMDDLKSRPVDPEELALFHNIHQARINGHLGRGYTILDSNGDNTACLYQKVSYFDDANRPLWFVYSGMGSQWTGMGAQLIRIPTFAAAIEKCRKVLEPKGIDIIHIITSLEETIFDNVLHAFVGIAAIQIGLTDVLLSLGLVPDNIIGHSVGELGCAYADGCLTAEEMILAAYSRGLVSVETPFIKGSMAAVGIGYQQVSKLLPPEIQVACHNSRDSATISGPIEVTKNFVAELTSQGIFAKEVRCSNIAFHSRYIAEAGPALLKYLTDIIKTPKPRSERWVSTSVPQDKWDQPSAKYCSAEYHTNNLLSPVLFEETAALIPSNAVLVEIAPYGLLQAILKRSLPPTCRYIPLTKRGHADNVVMVLDGIGMLFMEGFNPKIDALYPKVEFPVSTGTPMLSHLIEWAHDEKWGLPLYVSAFRMTAAACKFVVSIHDDEHKFLRGHIIRDKNLYPFSAALIAVWDTLAMTLNVPKKQMSVEFRDIHLFAQPPIHNYRQLKLSVALQRGSGKFEILEESRKVASGFIKNKLMETEKTFAWPFESNDQLNLKSQDVYRLLEDRDYSYQGEFRSIYKANQSLTAAEIAWNGNWVTFLDGFLQLAALNEVHNSVTQPYQIMRLCIDTERHKNYESKEVDKKKVRIANLFRTQNIARCGGVLLQNIKFRKLPRWQNDAVVLCTLKFIPRFQANLDVATALQVLLQVVAENINQNTLKVLGLLNSNIQEHLIGFKEVTNILEDIPGISINYEQMKGENVLTSKDYIVSEVDLVLVHNLGTDNNLRQMLYKVLRRDAFIVNYEDTITDIIETSPLYRVVSSQRIHEKTLELVKWRPTQFFTTSIVVTAKKDSDLKLITSKRENMEQNQKLVILSSYPAISGLKKLVKQWRYESDRNWIYLFMISEMDNLDQLPELDLAFSVLQDGEWGGEYYIPCQDKVVLQGNVALRTSKIGDLNTLKWVESSGPTHFGVPVTVHYAAINDTDVKKATGIYPLTNEEVAEETGFCMDFSGVTDSGVRVMGIIHNGAASRQVNVRPELLWPVPDHWSLEDAATVPTAYAHAFYCLAMKAQFIKGLRVLIHGGTGALGQAAISIALAHDCQIFATVSDMKKKRFLLKLFPELKEDHIGNSRDASFGDMVLCNTNGKGCDIIISCLSDEQKNICLKSCAASGITLDTVQIPSQDNFSFGMFYLTKARAYIPIDFTSVFASNNVDEMQKIQLLISEGIARGYVLPLSRQVYHPQNVSKAFRLVAGSHHRGRVLLKLCDSVLSAQPRIYCSPTHCHLVLCDEEALVVKMADRLISRGAANLRLYSANPSTRMRLKLRSWKKLGLKVEIYSEDLLNSDERIINLFNENNKLGTVEGIYIILTEESRKIGDGLNTDIVAKLDQFSRKYCPSIRYFVVVTDGSDFVQKICRFREQNNLPSHLVDLSGFINGKSMGIQKWHNNAVNAIELAIQSSQSNVLAYPKRHGRLSLLKDIARTFELKVTEDTNISATLMELGLKLANVSVVVSFLRDTHNIALWEKDIPELTVKQINELDSIVNGSKFPEFRGLKIFYSYIDPNELQATTEMVFLSTLSNTATMKDDEFDVQHTHICVIPGMEGHYSKFKILCERLKLPAVVLQPGLDHLQETLHETAERFAKKIELKDNFYLLGYETGVMVALQIAYIMENQGVTGTVYCIGGTPEEISTVIVKQMSEYKNEEGLQNAIIRHMYALMDANTEKLDTMLQNVLGWQKKVDMSIKMLLGQVPLSAQYARAVMEAAYTRIIQARVYRPQPKQLRSKIVWLHASRMSDVTPLMQMQQYSQQPVIVHELEATLAHATQDLRCSAIVNRYLESKLLEEFEEKNLCETYFLNADNVMMIN